MQIGHLINQRLLDHDLDACHCAPDASTLERVVLPCIHDGLPAPGLRFGEPRTMALLASLCCDQHLFLRADQPQPAGADRRADPRAAAPAR